MTFYNTKTNEDRG